MRRQSSYVLSKAERMLKMMENLQKEQLPTFTSTFFTNSFRKIHYTALMFTSQEEVYQA